MHIHQYPTDMAGYRCMYPDSYLYIDINMVLI